MQWNYLSFVLFINCKDIKNLFFRFAIMVYDV